MNQKYSCFVPVSLLGILALSVSVSGCGKDVSFESSEHPLQPRYPDEIEATTMYGPLVVNEGTHYYEPKGHEPWSAWHYQLNDRYFFTQTAGNKKFVSPLEKYDLYRRKYASPALKNPDSRAREAEQELFQSNGYMHVDGWMGYCHATAAAAVDRAAPTHSAPPSCPIPFTVADLRALIVRTYDNVPGSRNFGNNFNWERDTRNYVSQADIYPDQLIKLIQVVIGEQKRSFYIDADSGEEIWNEALLYAEVILRKDPANSHVLIGRLNLGLAKTLRAPVGNSSSSDPYDWLNSNGSNKQSESFTFELTGRSEPDGSFLVDFGEWTERSRRNHPDFATVLPDDTRQRHSSNNKEIKTEVVDEILEWINRGCR